MKKEKLYFKNEDSERCYTLDYFISDAKDEGLKEIELIEAVPEKLEDGLFFCKAVGEFCQTGDGYIACGKECSDYEPRNGKSGCCKYYSKTNYGWGKKVKITIPQGDPE